MTYALDEDWEQDYDRMVYASLIEPQKCTSIVASNFTLLTLEATSVFPPVSELLPPYILNIVQQD